LIKDALHRVINVFAIIVAWNNSCHHSILELQS
jgi:hypothetical protein